MSDVTREEREAIHRFGDTLKRNFSQRPVTAVTRKTGEVKSVAADQARLNVLCDGDDAPLVGVPCTTACVGVEVGDTVIVEFFRGAPIVTNVVAKSLDNPAYVITSFASGFEMYADTATHRPTVRRAGRVCTLSGACTPTRDVEGSSTQVTMFTLPEDLRPAQNVNALCQGSSRSRYLLTVTSDGSVQMSRYGTGSAYQTCEPRNWLTLNATWIIA